MIGGAKVSCHLCYTCIDHLLHMNHWVW